MKRIGTKNNLVKTLMELLAKEVAASRIEEALHILNAIISYEFKQGVSVFFYYDEIMDDTICLTENKEEIDWEASLIVEIMLSNKQNEGYGISVMVS